MHCRAYVCECRLAVSAKSNGSTSYDVQLAPCAPLHADCRGIFDLQLFDIEGNTINFERLLGRYVLVVNVHPADPHWDVQLEWMAAESASAIARVCVPS